MLKTKKLLENNYIFVIAAIIPFYYFINGFWPRHDSFHHAIVIQFVTNSLINLNEYPIWTSQVGHGMPFIFFDILSIGLIEFASILVARFFNVESLNNVFYIYIYLSNLVACFMMNKILVNIVENKNRLFIVMTNFIFIVTIQPLYSIYFNYRIIITFTCFLYFLIAFVKKTNIINIINLFSCVVIVGLIGNTFYATIMMVYIIFPALIYATVIKRKEIWTFQKIKLSQITMYLLVIVISLYLIYYYFSISHDFQFLSPGRNKDGTTNFDVLLTWGGFSGIDKFLVILGRNQIDANLVAFTGGLIAVYITIEFFSRIRNLQNRNMYFDSLIITVAWTLLLTFPSKGISSFMFSYMPGYSYIRHLSYFSTLLIPLLFILIYLISANGIAKHKMITSLLVIISLYSFIQYSPRLFFIYLMILIFIIFYRNRKGMNLLYFTLFCATFLSQWMLTTNFNHLGKISLKKFEDSNPIVRIDPAKSLKLQNLRQSTELGVLYSSISLFTNEEYCINYSNWQDKNYIRVDFLLKPIYESHPELWKDEKIDSNEFKFGCGYSNVVVVENNSGNILNQSLNYDGLYSATTRLSIKAYDEMRNYDLIYKNAYHSMWGATVNGVDQNIEEYNGYMKVGNIKNGDVIDFYIDRFVILNLIIFKILSFVSFVLLLLIVKKDFKISDSTLFDKFSR
jgi:hypothetical protein